MDCLLALLNMGGDPKRRRCGMTAKRGVCECGQSMSVGDDPTVKYCCIDCAMAMARELAEENVEGNEYPETEALVK